MKVTAPFILLILLTCTCRLSQAQSVIEVSRPELSIKDQEILIAYDILNSSESDKFSIRVEIADAKGRFIDARSLSGDVGEHVKGGFNKQVIWDIEADSIYLDEEIFIQVYALAEAPPVEEQIVPEEKPVVVKKSEVEETPLVEEKPEVEETSLVATNPEVDETSLVAAKPEVEEPQKTEETKPEVEEPQKTEETKPEVEEPQKGVVGYGCIAGALYFNSKAVSSYDAYKKLTNLEEVDDLYNKAVRQDVTSEVMAYAAIGIWVTDLVWTILGTANLNLIQTSGDLNGFSIGTTFEPVSSVPLLALRYKF